MHRIDSANRPVMIAVLLALLVVSSDSSAAPSSASTAISAPVSADDLRLLRDAVRDEMAGKRDQFTIVFDLTQYLPAFDNIVHYVGITGDRRFQIAVNYDYLQPRRTTIVKFETSNVAMVQAFVLGTIEIGAAGGRWKAYYNSLALADAALPAGVADRYLNRHAGTADLATAILALP